MYQTQILNRKQSEQLTFPEHFFIPPKLKSKKKGVVPIIRVSSAKKYVAAPKSKQLKTDASSLEFKKTEMKMITKNCSKSFLC